MDRLCSQQTPTIFPGICTCRHTFFWGVFGFFLSLISNCVLCRMGFSKMHAKAVIAARDAVCAPLVIHSSPSSVITESELAEISKLKTHRDNLTASASRFDECLTKLNKTLLTQQSAVNELFDQEIAMWERARTAALDRLRMEEVQFREQVNRAQASLTKDLELLQTAMSRINTLCSSPVRLDETHLLQYRQTQVSEMVHQSVMAPFLTLVQEPTWTIVRDAEYLIDVKTSPCVINSISTDVAVRKPNARRQFVLRRNHWMHLLHMWLAIRHEVLHHRFTSLIDCRFLWRACVKHS